MSHPKMNMRKIRRHPAVITDPAELQPEMEVAVCHLLPSIGRGTRCAQAMMGLTFPPKEATSKRERLMHGYRHNPAWGIVVNDVATVNWVNTTNAIHPFPYASLKVTRSTYGLTPAETSLLPIAHSMEEVMACIDELPIVDEYDYRSEARTNEFEAIKGFENLGLAPDPHRLNQFVIDLARLAASTSPVASTH